jgi:hypothetical protein
MKKLSSIALAATLLVSAASAHAYDVGVTLSGGTTGAGLHLVLPIIDGKLNGRLGVNAFNYSQDFSTNDVKYGGKLKLQTFDLLLDYHPFNGAFRVSAGAVINNNKIEANAKAQSGSYDFNGNTYNASDVGNVNGKIDFNNVAPYLGIGWGNAVAADKGWGFTSDLGVMFQGSPKATMSASECRLSPSLCTQLHSDLAAESSRLADEGKDFKFYPVIRVGVTYKF